MAIKILLLPGVFKVTINRVVLNSVSDEIFTETFNRFSLPDLRALQGELRR
jgi:hypothetical protein